MDTEQQKPTPAPAPAPAPAPVVTMPIDELWCWLIEDQRGSEVICAANLGGELIPLVFPKRALAESSSVQRAVDQLRKSSPGRKLRLVPFNRGEARSPDVTPGEPKPEATRAAA